MPEDLETRFRRLLLLIPFVLGRPGVEVKEVCERFGITRSQLIADINLLFVCGLPGYGPGDLIEAFVDGDQVFIRTADYFSRPLRLTAAEGLMLYCGGRALAEAGAGGESLNRAMAALESALGRDALERVDVELEGTEDLSAIRTALSTRRRVHLRYYAQSKDENTDRKVDPWALFASGGRWYLVAWCHKVKGERIFRVDRIRELTVLEEDADIPEDVDLSKYENLYVRGAQAVDVVLDLAPQVASWVADYYPLESQERLDDGWVRVHLSAGGTAWLERLLLVLGPRARIVEPQSLSERVRGIACGLAEVYRRET